MLKYFEYLSLIRQNKFCSKMANTDPQVDIKAVTFAEDQNVAFSAESSIDLSANRGESVAHLVIVLDASRSMSHISKQMVDAINALIVGQKAVENAKPTKVSIISFNWHRIRVVDRKDLQQVDAIRYTDYRTEAGSKIRDSVSDTIREFNDEKDVLMVIVTDGEDIGSYTSVADLARQINKKKIDGWKFHYLSCDEKTMIQGKSIGFTNDHSSVNVQYAQTNFPQYLSSVEFGSQVSEFRSAPVSTRTIRVPTGTSGTHIPSAIRLPVKTA